MKKLLSFLSASLFLLSCCPSSHAAEYELSLSLAIPPVHARWTEALKPWTEELERRSGGRIKVEPYFAESLNKEAEAFDAVRNGLADIAEASFNAAAGQFPFHERSWYISDTSRSLDKPSEIIHQVEQEFPQVMKELEGAKMLFSHCVTVGSFIGTIKPVKSLEELRGMKIVTSAGPNAAARLSALGITVVPMPSSDVYMAMQQGIVDGCMVDFQLLVSRRFGDLIKHVIPITLAGGTFYCVMNQDVYDGMPDDLKKVVDDVSREYSDKVMPEFWDRNQYESCRVWMQEMGGQIHMLTEQEYAEAAAKMEPVLQDWIEKVSETGLPGEAIARRHLELQAEKNALWKDSRLIREFVSPR